MRATELRRPLGVPGVRAGATPAPSGATVTADPSSLVPATAPLLREAALLAGRLLSGDVPPLPDMERVVNALYFGGDR